MIHLGDRIAAYVDGELPHGTRERVLSHLSACAQCRAAADAQRLVKAGVAGIQDPAPSPDLTRRLLALAEPGEPLPPRRRLVDTSPRPPSVPVGRQVALRAAAARPPSGATPARPPGPPRFGSHVHRRQRLQFFAAASLGMAAVALGAAAAIGGREQPGPAVSPGDWFAVEHAATTRGVPLVDPAMSMTAGFVGTGAGSRGGSDGWGAAPYTGAYVGEVYPR